MSNQSPLQIGGLATLAYPTAVDSIGPILAAAGTAQGVVDSGVFVRGTAVGDVQNFASIALSSSVVWEVPLGAGVTESAAIQASADPYGAVTDCTLTPLLAPYDWPLRDLATGIEVDGSTGDPGWGADPTPILCSGPMTTGMGSLCCTTATTAIPK